MNNVIVKADFCICLNRLNPADRIKNITQIWMPLNVAAIHDISIKALKKSEIK